MANARSQEKIETDYVADARALELVVKEKMREHVREESDRRRIERLLKGLRVSAKTGNFLHALSHAYNLGCQITRVILNNHYGSTGHTRLATIGRKAVAQGIARKAQRRAETMRIAESIYWPARQIALANPKRGRLDIVKQVMKTAHLAAKRNPRTIYDILKTRLPPREK
jgi:hypothetical protein